MPTYIYLGKFTDEGIKDIKNEMKNQEKGIKMAEEMGIKMIGAYYLMGEYDVIGICECPSDEVAVSFVLSAPQPRTMKFKTIKAFTAEEFGAIVDKLP